MVSPTLRVSVNLIDAKDKLKVKKKFKAVSKEKAEKLIKGEPKEQEKKSRSSGEIRRAMYGKDK